MHAVMVGGVRGPTGSWHTQARKPTSCFRCRRCPKCFGASSWRR
ncbi:MAG: hypothetical protein ABI606_05665 [Rhodoferax sp.]